MPVPVNCLLAVFKAPPDVQDDPLYSLVLSTLTVPLNPPKANPAVCIPVAPKAFKATGIAPPAVQFVPSNSSTAVVLGSLPPTANAAVCVPKPAS